MLMPFPGQMWEQRQEQTERNWIQALGFGARHRPSEPRLPSPWRGLKGGVRCHKGLCSVWDAEGPHPFPPAPDSFTSFPALLFWTVRHAHVLFVCLFWSVSHEKRQFKEDKRSDPRGRKRLAGKPSGVASTLGRKGPPSHAFLGTCSRSPAPFTAGTCAKPRPGPVRHRSCSHHTAERTEAPRG